MTTTPQRLFAAKAEGRTYDDFIEVWFVATAPVSRERFIGVILFDADMDAKVEMLADAGDVIYDETNDKDAQPLVSAGAVLGSQGNGDDDAAGVLRMPARILRQGSREKRCRKKQWRDDVRRRASADD